VQLPPEAEMVHYSACQDAIWALDTLGQIFIRTLSSSCPTGMHWTKLDLSQLGMTFLWRRLSLDSLSGQSLFSFRSIFWFTDMEYYICWIKSYLTLMGLTAEDRKTSGTTMAFKQCLV